MRTFQGAEVIIPNSAFVSEQVINWTLSESRRRVEIPVGVAYGTDPERVIQTLLEIAGTHAEVLREPAHTAVFQGFGESSLNFLLMFWADQNVHFRLRSEICVRIDVAFRQAGIDIALPQREIRVHSVPSTPTFTQSA
jgi:small-conductance mechanosensitive channel